MKKYKIYAGLKGTFCKTTYQYTIEEDSIEAAKQDAYERACEIYYEAQSDGIIQVLPYSYFLQKASKELNEFENFETLEAYADMFEDDYRNSIIDYYVKEEENEEN